MSTEPTSARARDLEHPSQEEIRLVAVLHALSDPIRLRIVCHLAQCRSEMACIAFDLPVSKSTCTHHFRVLREAGIIRQHYRGTSRMNELRDDDLEARFPGLLNTVLAAASSQE